MIEKARALRETLASLSVRRVRHHDDQSLGFHAVTIDPRGYRTGSLNEGLPLRAA